MAEVGGCRKLIGGLFVALGGIIEAAALKLILEGDDRVTSEMIIGYIIAGCVCLMIGGWLLKIENIPYD